jgi:3-carboxy-cis,cis-muconate cycloisomerase
LLELTVTAASQTAELSAGLEVDADAMRRRAEDAAVNLLAERGRPGKPNDYLGATSELVDAILARFQDAGPDHG